MKPSLVILAAGYGSRFGGLKQLLSVGPGDATIMDYSIYDALETGFENIIVVVREQIKTKLEEHVSRWQRSGLPPIRICIQPWIGENGTPPGTGPAVLASASMVNGDFVVINADDFYGRGSFKLAFDFLVSNPSKTHHAIIAYPLGSTLSDHGPVNRAICLVNDEGLLSHIYEAKGLTASSISRKTFPLPHSEHSQTVAKNFPVSMNFWCFRNSTFSLLENGYEQFLANQDPVNPTEYLIPDYVDAVIPGQCFEVFSTMESWYGITFKEDVPTFISKIKEKITAGIYPEILWER